MVATIEGFHCIHPHIFTDVKECASEVAPAGVSPMCLTSEPCSTEDEQLQYSESTLDKVMHGLFHKVAVCSGQTFLPAALTLSSGQVTDLSESAGTPV